MSSESYHEPIELLSEPTKNMHRALISLCEELKAVDGYQQRAEAGSDPELAAVLTHNKNDEIEHAMMTLEWIRRHNPTVADNIKTYVGSEGPILEVEKKAAQGGGGGGDDQKTTSTSLGIGSLKGKP